MTAGTQQSEPLQKGETTMKKFIAIALILLIPILFGITGAYAESGPESTTEPMTTESDVPEIGTEPSEPETTEQKPEETVAETTESTPEKTTPATTASEPEETIPETTASEPEETVPETTASTPEDPVPETGSLTIRRARAEKEQAFWYTVEQHQADGFYLELVKVAILPGETAVTVTGLTLETGYRITEHVMTSDGDGFYEHVELIRLKEESPNRELVFSGTLRTIGWFADFTSSTEKKEG